MNDGPSQERPLAREVNMIVTNVSELEQALKELESSVAYFRVPLIETIVEDKNPNGPGVIGISPLLDSLKGINIRVRKAVKKMVDIRNSLD